MRRATCLAVLVALGACSDAPKSLAIDGPMPIDTGVDAVHVAAGDASIGDAGVDGQSVHHEGEACDHGACCDPGLVCKAVGDPCPTFPRCSVCYVPCVDAGTCPPGYRTCIPPSGQGGDVCIH
jgi:hypothetical protein